MMRTLKQRVLLTLAATLVAAACGMLATFLLVCVLAFASAEAKLGQDSVQLLTEIGAILNESHAVLKVMNASQDPFCSDAEITSFRKLMFNSQFLRDAGRLRDGRIQCSATLGRESLPTRQFKPAARMPDGSSLYADLSPIQPHAIGALGQQIGDSYVVLDSYEFKRLDLIDINRSATVIDAATNQLRHPGRTLPVDGAILDRNWGGRIGNLLFATRCAPHYPICMTTFIPISDVLRARSGQLIGFTSLGGVIGGVFGFFCSLLYKRNRSMVQQLRRAIARDKLRVVYQPIVSLADRRIVGAEALARWTDEEGFAVGPDVFIKLAEERGFVGSITRLVVRHALQDFADTLRNHPSFQLSVNVAAADLADPGFLPMLKTSVTHAEVATKSLAIEITEGSTVRNAAAMETIRQLRDLGHSIHLDDFGTGYSSLSYLNDLSVDAIKIDKSFTRAIGTGAVIGSILPQILSIADALNLGVIVEGIETEEQARYFENTEERILAQGWMFGYPVAAGDFLTLLAKEQRQARLPAGEPSAADYAESIAAEEYVERGPLATAERTDGVYLQSHS
jgi:sensor c-di-GMP phosphodiesterase-like protein